MVLVQLDNYTNIRNNYQYVSDVENNKVNDSHDVEQLIKELSFSYQKTLKLIWECFVVLNTPI